MAGSVSRTQLIEREGMSALGKAREHLAEQIRFLKAAGVDFLILETFFHLAEMEVALQCAAEAGLPAVATLSFRPLISQSTDDRSPAECARVMAGGGAVAVGANCEQEPTRMLPVLREMRQATQTPIAAQPAAFRTTDSCHCFTRQPAFPDDLRLSRFPATSLRILASLLAPRDSRTSAVVADAMRPISGPSHAAWQRLSDQ